MAKQLVSQADFARMHSVSRKTVTTWKSRNWLIFEGDLVDVAASNALLKKYRTTGAGTFQEQAAPGNTGNKGNSQPAPAQPPIDLLPGETVEQAAERLTSANLLAAKCDVEEAKRIKENYLALLHKLDFEKKSGSLIELDVAQHVLFDEFRRSRDAWMNWPTRIGPLVAADLGIEADVAVRILTEHVHKHLTSLGEPEGDFSTDKG